jgi:hypothetical protein
MSGFEHLLRKSHLYRNLGETPIGEIAAER